MPYSELIKNYDRIREYLRDFYVYGFKSRTEFTLKSARSYDDERRRVESWLGEHMKFRRNAEGKNVFISIDSRVTKHNPLYRSWKAKSFTDGDITLHFCLFDVLCDPSVSLTLAEIESGIDDILGGFDAQPVFDESTIRKKLKEYAEEGIITTEKRGKTVYYRRAADSEYTDADILDFFSEVAPCGVIGSFLIDKLDEQDDPFVFKHHYLTSAMDSGILCSLFDAMREERFVKLTTCSHRTGHKITDTVIPLRVLLSVQNGRQYLMAYSPSFDHFASIRLDYIVSAEPGDVCPEFKDRRARFDALQAHMWGVSLRSPRGTGMDHVDFTVCYDDDEGHIPLRLEREKRCGTVERLDAHHSRFSADVCDAAEMIPWIRTFLCRITDLHISNEFLEKRFREDLRRMYAMYGVEGGDGE